MFELPSRAKGKTILKGQTFVLFELALGPLRFRFLARLGIEYFACVTALTD